MTLTFHANGKIEGINNSNFNSSLPSGHVIQVVETINDSVTSITSSAGSFTATGFSASITPTSASSKILVQVSTSFYVDNDDNTGGVTVYRNGSVNLGGSTSYGLKPIYFYAGGGANDNQIPVNMHHLDSPATTSSVTYEVYYRSDKSGNRLNGIRSGRQSFILTEISG